MKKFSIIIIFILALCQLSAQELTGCVKEIDDNQQESLIIGAILQWKGTDLGTTTNAEGQFSLERSSKTDTLVVIYQAYDNDTIVVPKDQKELNIVLSSAHNLAAVNVSAHDGSYVSVKPILTTVITTQGLRKAACCNLAESFESTVAVDVEYSDAITGAKQISMLGLAGIYSQILLENVPFVRLLSNQFGLGFVPGTWMESISVSKGVASVTNGYEAISGQIDVEYKKPETNRERLFVNLFGNTMGKGEFNLNSRFDVGKSGHASSMILAHGEGQFAKVDMNKDGFMDVPQNYQINLMNRWDYDVPGKFEGRTWISYLFEDRIGGQMHFDPKKSIGETLSEGLWGMRIKTNKLDITTKNGFLLAGEHESIGTILSFTFHDNVSQFGDRPYKGRQISGYANILYSNRFGALERSKLTAGASFQMDFVNEFLSTRLLADQAAASQNIKRNELVPGIFAEYSYSIEDKLVVMPGIRLDYNVAYNKLFWTPRLHIKWQAGKNSSFRFSAGKGYRVSNVITENQSLLISNRDFVFDDTQGDKADLNKGLLPEEAYNAGVSFVQSFDMPGGKSTFSIDYYYTHFINQTIIDMDQDIHSIHVYNLNGNFNGKGNKSYSHSAQAELILNPIQRFEIILAYRYNLVKQTTNHTLQDKALTSPHKALISLSYATKYDKWKFNVSLQYHSKMRLPDMSSNPVEYQPTPSKGYFMLNAQITKKYKSWEFYIGGENLANQKQANPIISADNPYGEYFDASIIHSPITGIMGYIGFRYSMK